jgi:GntR family transcriptional regulator
MIPLPPWWTRSQRPLRRRAPEPKIESALHRQIALHFEMSIATGRWQPDQRIATETDLAKRIGVSRGTIRAAIATLVRKGLLRRRTGCGTFVVLPPMDTLERCFESQEGHGFQTVADRGERVPAAWVAGALQLPNGEPIPFLRRLRQRARAPFLIIDSWFPPPVWQRIVAADKAGWLDHPWDDGIYRDDPGVCIAVADERMTAGIATTEEAEIMRLSPAGAVIRIERISYDRDSQPLELRLATGRADEFRFSRRLARFEPEDKRIDWRDG